MSFLLILLLPIHGLAYQQSYNSLMSVLNKMQGEWYDDSGNVVLRIYNGYINGCKVVAGYDFVGSGTLGSGKVSILESTGERGLYLEWGLRGNKDTDYINLNDTQLLHRTNKVSYYESIAGVYLGMTADKIKAKLGNPTYTGDLNQYLGGHWHLYGWYYEKQGILITFNAHSIDRIILLKNSKQTLFHSGLNCSNTAMEFAQTYNLNRIPEIDYADHISYNIGHGEYLSFGAHMDYIMLSNYSY